MEELVIIHKPIIDLATTFDIIEGAPNRTLESAILIMGSKKFRRMPITKLSRIKGILTVTDIIRAISEVGLPHAYQELISDWMTENPKTVNGNITIKEASELMREGHFGSLLIVDDTDTEILKGIITERDILRHFQTKEWGNRKISEIDKSLIETGLIKVNAKVSLEEAIRKMNDHHVHRVLLTNNEGKLTGILTANDITRLSSKEREEINENPNFLKSITADFVGTNNPITCDLDGSIGAAIEIMCDKNIGALPVLSNGEVIGVLSERTVVHLISLDF